DGQGRPWLNLFGTNRIATIDPNTFEAKEHALPNADARTRRIEIGQDGGIWYVDYARGSIGRLDPATGDSREWQTPGGSGSRPYAMAADDRGRMWLVETGAQPNQFVGFDPGT